MTEHSAVAVLQLWDLVEQGHEPPPTMTFAEMLGRKPTSMSDWCAEHACCFGPPARLTCSHPKPPADHMF